MNTYDMLMNPLEKHLLKNIRQKYMNVVQGQVLEVGIGTSINLSYYDFDCIKSFIGLDKKLSSELSKKATEKTTFVECSTEDMFFEDNSFDTVVGTLVLCSVTNANKTVNEIKRVLRNEGRFVFIEHILPSENNLAKAFNACNGIWSKLSCGCNINRRTDVIIAENFEVLQMDNEGKGIFCYGIAKNLK